jgi:hypothetical protein
MVFISVPDYADQINKASQSIYNVIDKLEIKRKTAKIGNKDMLVLYKKDVTKLEYFFMNAGNRTKKKTVKRFNKHHHSYHRILW